jgi:hypothetical protein
MCWQGEQMKDLLRIYRQMLVIVLFAFAADLLARDTLTPVPLLRVRPPNYIFEYWNNKLDTRNFPPPAPRAWEPRYPFPILAAPLPLRPTFPK